VKVSLNFLVRIGGMLALAMFGAYVGRSLSGPNPDETQILATRLLMLAGAGLGLLVTPRLTIDPVQNLLRRIRTVPLSEIFLIAVGALIGLIFAVLLSVPLAFLPPPFRNYTPLIVAMLFAYIGAKTFALRKRELSDLLLARRRVSATAATADSQEEPGTALARFYLLDTSAIIDGRIATVSQTGFLEGTLMVPHFVLAELQSLADSGDDLRRSKGRRGLDLLNQMQQNQSENLPIEVVNIEVSGATRVDDMLVVLARQYNCPIITNDFNLNRVAGLQGVRVLSLNQLSEALRPPVVQDQHLHVLIRNEGNARRQGVGYLDDGTPVIVEDARHLIGQSVEVVVTRLHQTQTGRMVFAQVKNGTPSEEPQPAADSQSA
jgi:uncharacterized protein YacL